MGQSRHSLEDKLASKNASDRSARGDLHVAWAQPQVDFQLGPSILHICSPRCAGDGTAALRPQQPGRQPAGRHALD